MKALYIVEPHRLAFKEIPLPKIQAADEILVKVMAAGICGSDLHNFHGTASGIPYPIIPGHEMSGRVVAVGDGVKDVMVGDHVTADVVSACGHCYPCSLGRRNVCENIKARGSHIDGCFCEYMVIKATDVYPYSKDIPWQRAALIEPYTIGGQCAAVGRVKKGDVVYITGAGPIGICTMQICKLLNATVIISDLFDTRLLLAEEMGADIIINAKKEKPEKVIAKLPGVQGITVAVDTVGVPCVFESLVKMILPTGRIVSLSFSANPVSIFPVDITKKEIEICGSRMSCNQFPKIIKYFEEGKIDGTKMISKVFPFSEAIEAFREAEINAEQNCKILIDFTQ